MTCLFYYDLQHGVRIKPTGSGGILGVSDRRILSDNDRLQLWSTHDATIQHRQNPTRFYHVRNQTHSTWPWWRHQMEHFPRYWPFVWGIHRWPVNSTHKGQWHGALMLSTSISAWISYCTHWKVWVELLIHSEASTLWRWSLEWNSHFISCFTGHVIIYLCWNKVNLC